MHSYSKLWKYLFSALFSLILSLTTYCQISFRIPCAANELTASITSDEENIRSLLFSWTNQIRFSVTNTDLRSLTTDQLKRTYVKQLYQNSTGRLLSNDAIVSITIPDSSSIVLSETKKNSFPGIADLSNGAVRTSIYNSLQNQIPGLCTGQASFFRIFDSELNRLTTASLQRTPSNNRITHSNETANIIQPGPKKKALPYYYNDVRNPIAFTRFIIRQPVLNGRQVMTTHDNFSSYYYIRPGSNIMITFAENILSKMSVPKIFIRAYLKRKDQTIVPVKVDNYYDVQLLSNSTSFENTLTSNGSSDELNYNYQITPNVLSPQQVEISTANLNTQEGDKIVVTIGNESDGRMSFTTTFEFEDFGWAHGPTGGFSWLNTHGDGDKNFRPAGAAGYSFYWKHSKGGSFFNKFISPSFGPELYVLENGDAGTQVGLAFSASVFLRTVKFGYGFFLSGENRRTFFSIGVNFIEGFQSISSILKNVQSGPQP